MVIDFHTHVPSGTQFGIANRGIDGFLSDMDFNGIEKSLLLPFDALFFQSVNENREIGEWVKRHPDRFEGLGTVNARKPDEAIPEMVRCILEYGLIGLKFHPWLQAFSPLEKSFLELAEEGNRYKTLFFFHDGTPPYTEPFQIAEVAEKNPDLVVVMGHTGLNDLWRESLLAAKKYDNVWLCLSACPFWGMVEVIKQVDNERIVWGSDYPLANRMDTKNRLRQVELLPFSDDLKEKILYGNAKKLIQYVKNSMPSQ